ncbi:MAG: hypothetical protein DMC59_04900 [Verrucomicrobia bacterium]|nr:MAG: hypothetical protein DMC59_04900 [Verrucomicrobiota bacterium]
MKFSVNWLREFVDLPKNLEEIAELLTRAGVETENIETRSANVEEVIVSQIAASSRHPNADRLTVCEVDDGSGTKRQIVCGATNYKVGDKVPLALPGAKLPNGTEIRKSKLRGVESEGMLCSPIELGLGEDASGLLILSPDAKVGAPISDLFPADTILDVEITPNRGDLLSHFGLAREIAALTGKKLKSTPRDAKIPVRKTGVTIISTRECPFFSARKIDNVRVGPSPQWLREKIESVGIRSINNIVDISNFVMARWRKISRARRQNLLVKTRQLRRRRSRARGWDRRRDGWRRNGRHRFDEKYFARGRILSAGERSQNRARIKSAERRELSFRARC